MLNAAPVANDDTYTMAEDGVLRVGEDNLPAGVVPQRWSENGHYYALITNRLTAPAAIVAAAGFDFKGSVGHLVTITSAAERDFLFTAFSWPSDRTRTIGLTDVEQEGVFRWVTGEPLTYTSWLPGEPNNSNNSEDYVELRGDRLWNDNNAIDLREYIVEFDGPIVAPIVSNDTDADGDLLTAALVAAPEHGTLTLDANGTFSYTPDRDFAGADSFTYMASDGEADSKAATVTINVTQVNDAPSANPERYLTPQNEELTVAAAEGVLANDTDPEADPLTALLVTAPTKGQLALNPNGSFIYTPNADYFGPDSFSYRTSDGKLQSQPATVSLFVTNPDNQPPTATNDQYTTSEDGVLTVSGSLPGGQVPQRWSVNGHYYALISSSLPAVQAITAAQSLRHLGSPGHLVTIANAAERDFLTGTFGVALGNPSVLIGLSDAAQEGVWRWVTGEAATFTSWNGGEPNGGTNENYVEMFANGTWNDLSGQFARPYLVEFDGPFLGGVLTNDSDANKDALSAVLVAPPEHGTLVLNPDGTFVYTPNSNYNGTDSFTYKANDGELDSNVATVNITIEPVDDAPITAPDSYTVVEDKILTVTTAEGVLANDRDPEGDSFKAVLVEPPQNGDVTLNADGSFTYTPDLDFAGADTFTYRATNSLESEPATVTIEVSPVNDAPVAAGDAFVVNEDDALTVADPLTTVQTIALPAGDLVYDAANEKFFATVLGSGGMRANSLTLIDPETGELGASLPVGTDPRTIVVSSDGRYIHTVVEDGHAVQIVDMETGTLGPKFVLPGSGQFAERVRQIYAIPGKPDTVLITRFYRGQSLPAAGTSVYTAGVELPDVAGRGLGSGGPDITAVDPNGMRAFGYEAVVSSHPFYVMSILPTGVRVTQELRGFLSGGRDVIRYSRDRIFTDRGEVRRLSTNTAAGSFEATPHFVIDEALNRLFALTRSGTTQTIHIYDLDSLNKLDTIVLNGLPAVQGSLIRFGEDGLAFRGEGDRIVLVHSDKVSGNPRRGVLRNDTDVDGDTLTATVVDDVSHGTLTLNTDGTFKYTPESNFHGVDSFTYRASDGKLQSELAKVTITVNPVNDPPATKADKYSVAEDSVLTVAAAEGVLTNDTDLESDPFTASVEARPANGTLVLSANGSFTYTPNADFFGTDTFTYRASDTSASQPTTVTIEVTPVNDAPVAVNDMVSVTEDTAVTVRVLANDQDVDDDVLAAKVISGPSNGTVTRNDDNTFTYTPNLNFTGADSITYRVSDGRLESNTATVTLNVTPVNDAPVAAPDTYFIANTLTVGVANGVLANDTDVDSPTSSLTAQLVSPPAHGFLTFNADGSFTYTQAASFAGSDTFTYRTSDGSAISEPTTVSIVAALRLRTENVTVIANSQNQVEGQFDVFLDVATGVEFTVAAYDVSLRTPAGSGVTLVSASAPSAAHPGIFTSEPIFFTAQGRLAVTDGLAAGSAPLDNGDGLFRVRFTVAPGTTGEVPILFTTAFTNLADENGQPLPLGLAPGMLTLVGLPEAVTNVTATATAANKVRLAWADSFTNESGFKIDRLEAGNFVQIATVGPNVTSFDDANLQSSLNYSYRVRAYNAAGDGPASETVSAMTPQLVTINGTPGHDTYHVIRVGTLLSVYENTTPVGQPAYSSELAAMADRLTINTLGGDDMLIVISGGQTTLGVEQLIYNAGTGANELVLASGSARIESSADSGGVLNTIVQSAGRLSTTRFLQNGLVLENSSRVTLLPDGQTSVVTRLTLGTGATFDIGNNALVVDYTGASPLGGIREKILSGRGRSGLGASWRGTGITSSDVAQANLAEPESRSIGYAENAALPLGAYTNFRGIAVDDTAVLIAYTRTGDANLDGFVDDDDATVLGASYAPTAAGALWARGDFEYNGFVDDDDATLLGVFYSPAAIPLPQTDGDDTLVDLLAEAIVSDAASSMGDGLSEPRLANGRKPRAADSLWRESLWR
ncbi:MAG: Ig-like domain-containing protein [Pirellulales bacterium]